MRPYSRVYATVDLTCIEENIKAIKHLAGENTSVIGVVKADGYGHGSVPVAKTIAPWVSGYAVATAEEGVQLRDHGITKPVMILGKIHDSLLETALEHDLQPVMFQESQARVLSELAVSRNQTAGVQLALDTGMGRIGWQPDQAAVREVKSISRMPGIQIRGLFTHFARADEQDKSFTGLQLHRYREFVRRLREEGVDIPMTHCANSAALMDLEETGLDAVRAGIILYGLYPSEEVKKDRLTLQPAMELKSAITYIKEVEPGTVISYGSTFTASRPMRVATVPVGYGDGYPRNLSGRGAVLVRGKRAAILGRVCMDQFMIDVTEIPDAAEDDQVTLIGRDGEEQISIEETAAACGGFHYELPCVLGKRVPRVYIKDGQIVGKRDFFQERYEDFL